MSLRCKTWKLATGEWEHSPTLVALAENAGADPVTGDFVILRDEEEVVGACPLARASFEDVRLALAGGTPSIHLPSDTLDEDVSQVLFVAELSHFLLTCRKEALYRPAAYYIAEQGAVRLVDAILSSSLAARLGLRKFPAYAPALLSTHDLDVLRRAEESGASGVIIDASLLDWTLWERALETAIACARRLNEAYAHARDCADVCMIDWTPFARDDREMAIMAASLTETEPSLVRVGLMDLGQCVPLRDLPECIRKTRASVLPCLGRLENIWYLGLDPESSRNARRVRSAKIAVDRTSFDADGGVLSFEGVGVPNFYARVNITPTGMRALRKKAILRLSNARPHSVLFPEFLPPSAAEGRVECSYRETGATIALFQGTVNVRIDSLAAHSFHANATLPLLMPE